MRPELALLLSCACVTAFAESDCRLGGEAKPNTVSIREHDLRFVIPANEPRYRAFDHVGAVFIPSLLSAGELRKSGSGTLIDACHVLTAYHVVFPEIDLIRQRPFKFDPARAVHFRFGRRDASAPEPQEFLHSIEGYPLDLGIFDPYSPIYTDELLLVRLKRSAPVDYAPLALDGDTGYSLGEHDFIAAGFPLDGMSRGGMYQLYGDRCAILGFDLLGGYATNCSLTPGVSGGALFRVHEDAECQKPAELRLAGVPNQQDGPDLFPKNHPRRRSYVVPIARNRKVLEKALAADSCLPPANSSPSPPESGERAG